MAKMRIELEMQDPARAVLFEWVFGSRVVLVTTWLPRAQLHGDGDAESVQGFELDLSLITVEQRERLTDYIVAVFGSRRAYAERGLDTVGFGINAHKVTVRLYHDHGRGDEVTAEWSERGTVIYKPAMLLG